MIGPDHLVSLRELVVEARVPPGQDDRLGIMQPGVVGDRITRAGARVTQFLVGGPDAQSEGLVPDERMGLLAVIAEHEGVISGMVNGAIYGLNKVRYRSGGKSLDAEMATKISAVLHSELGRAE